MLPPVSCITITNGLYYANVFIYAADLTEEVVNAVKVQLCHCRTLCSPTVKRFAQKAALAVKTFCYNYGLYYHLTLNQSVIPNLNLYQSRTNESMFEIHLLADFVIHTVVIFAWFEVCSSGTKLSEIVFIIATCLSHLTTNYWSCYCHSLKLAIFHSGDDSDVDSEVEDRVDGVKSWLSKNKGSTKTLSDDGNLKAPR